MVRETPGCVRKDRALRSMWEKQVRERSPSAGRGAESGSCEAAATVGVWGTKPWVWGTQQSLDRSAAAFY